jgi:hypothetical protein
MSNIQQLLFDMRRPRCVEMPKLSELSSRTELFPLFNTTVAVRQYQTSINYIFFQFYKVR